MNLHLLKQLANDWPSAVTLRTFTVTPPTAGADWTFSTPGESVLGIVSISARLVTSAVVANRAPILQVGDGNTTFFKVAPDVVQAASLTVDMAWLPELAANDTSIIGNVTNVALPPLYLPSGFQISTATNLIDVGDQWSRITILAIETYHGEREQERTVANAVAEHYAAVLDLLEGNI